VSTPEDIITLAITGLVAGALGGLFGIGGSVLMIPAMTIFLRTDQHLAQATAMIVNIFVALPAALRHHRMKAVRFDAFQRILPIAVIFILLGVVCSNLLPGPELKKVFGAFLLYVAFTTIMQLIKRQSEPLAAQQRLGWWPCGAVGSITGFAAGILGIGGGLIAVPLMQRICRLPIRQSIATSSALMAITAIFGAALKNWTLAEHVDSSTGEPLRLADSLLYAALLTPTAILGAYLGAGLTHRLPLLVVRVAFLLLLIWGALEMLGIL